jgi:hypothetical protein
MRVCLRMLSLVVVPALLLGGCSKRNLMIGGATIGLDAGGAPEGGGVDTGAPPTDVGGEQPTDTGPLRTDAAESPCVSAAFPLPWTRSAATIGHLDVVTTPGAIAVANRQGKQLDVRTYTRDGAIIGGFQFAADAQFLPYREGRFLLVARGVTGSFNATAIDPDLVAGTRLYGAASSATEHMLGTITLETTTVVITDEHFVNLGTGRSFAWSTVFGAGDGAPFQSSRIYGMAAQADRVLIAWGAADILRLAVLDTAGTLVASLQDDNFLALSYLGAETATAIPWDTGLLLFDGNPVRLTQIGFDLSRTVIGENQQLRTFYRTAPRIAAVPLAGRPIGARPIAFWLTVFPATDNSQGFTTHQLYGCALDLAAPAGCATTALIAATGLGGYEIAQEPVAAAALPASDSFAIAHTDVDGRAWLRVADLACASARP